MNKNLEENLLLCKDECSNIIYNSNLNDSAQNRKQRYEKLQTIIKNTNKNKNNINDNKFNNNNSNNNNSELMSITFNDNIVEQLETNLKTAGRINAPNVSDRAYKELPQATIFVKPDSITTNSVCIVAFVDINSNSESKKEDDVSEMDRLNLEIEYKKIAMPDDQLEWRWSKCSKQLKNKTMNVTS